MKAKEPPLCIVGCGDLTITQNGGCFAFFFEKL
jgi:hypothetical protein